VQPWLWYVHYSLYTSVLVSMYVCKPTYDDKFIFSKQGKQRGVGGDMRGDGYQNGGLLVVEKGGKVLYSFIQENPADHAQNEDVLKVIHTSY
jgi:hypothetical protein